MCTIIHMQPPATAARIAVLAVAVLPLGSQHLPAHFMLWLLAVHEVGRQGTILPPFALFTMHC